MKWIETVRDGYINCDHILNIDYSSYEKEKIIYARFNDGCRYHICDIVSKKKMVVYSMMRAIVSYQGEVLTQHEINKALMKLLTDAER